MIEEFFTSWIESIIVVVFLSIIIEFLLNESKYKKIVNIVLNIYLILVIINPIFENKLKEIDVEDFFKIENVEPVDGIDVENTISEVFKNNIKNRIEKIAKENSIKIEKTEINIENLDTGEIKNIMIYVENVDNKIKDEMRKKLSSEFEIAYEKIIIKGE